MVLPWCARGIVVVWSWCGGGAVAVWWRCGRGVSLCGYGVVVAWSWYDRGGVVELVWRWGGRKSPHPPFVDVIYFQYNAFEQVLW